MVVTIHERCQQPKPPRSMADNISAEPGYGAPGESPRSVWKTSPHDTPRTGSADARGKTFIPHTASDGP
jgi:hypothetical protein